MIARLKSGEADVAVALTEGLVKDIANGSDLKLLGTSVAIRTLFFVTHIFLMESIWDTSLEAQVIARAHRMGSRTSVLVEQLVARDTVDEVLCRIKAGTLTVAGEDGDGGAAEHDGRRRGSGRRARPPSAKALRKRLEGGRLRFVLRQLRLLRTAEDAVPRVADDGRGAAPLPERPPLRRRRIAAAEGGADEPRGGEKRVRFAL